MPSESKFPAGWARLYSLGIELAAAVAGFSLLGYWIDRHYETDPWGILICFALGLIGGMYNFLRSAIQQYRESAGVSSAADAEAKPDRPGEE
jgi:F0F1-type ATP synthase assembly protein I